MTWERRVSVRGSSGNRYTVAVRSDTGAWGCDCPAWKFKKADAAGMRPDCKHITAIKMGLPQNESRFAALDLGARSVAALGALEVGARFAALDFQMEVSQ